MDKNTIVVKGGGDYIWIEYKGRPVNDAVNVANIFWVFDKTKNELLEDAKNVLETFKNPNYEGGKKEVRKDFYTWVMKNKNSLKLKRLIKKSNSRDRGQHIQDIKIK